MALAFVKRNPTPGELERFRLILSTYQDGSGMLALKDGRTIPGWRDFERALATAFGGQAQESKAIFDVLLPDQERPGISFGLSCKMRATLDRIDKDNRVTIELSNSAGKFWQHLKTYGIDQSNYRVRPAEVGVAIVELVEQWHRAVSIEQGGRVDLAGSSYLVLSYNGHGSYQLHQFPRELPDPSAITWHFPVTTRKGVTRAANHLRGEDAAGTIFEWYGESGGQLKYYPLATSAIWKSERFQLEPFPLEQDRAVLIRKAETYFPNLWAHANSLE